MALDVEAGADGGVRVEDALRRSWRIEAGLVSLPSSDWMVRDLHKGVRSPARDVSVGRSRIASGCTIGAESGPEIRRTAKFGSGAEAVRHDWVGRRRRIRAAWTRPNFSAQRRSLSQQTSMPRSASRSSTSRSLGVKRKQSQTAYRMIPDGNR
jgi:hypothetical protein